VQSDDGDSETMDSQASGSTGADVMQSMFVDALAQAIAGSDRAGLAHELELSLREAAK